MQRQDWWQLAIPVPIPIPFLPARVQYNMDDHPWPLQEHRRYFNHDGVIHVLVQATDTT